MKILLLMGNHPRHRFLAEPIFKIFSNIKSIVMNRESYVKGPDYNYVDDREKKLILKHFKKRFDKEKNAFGLEDIYSLTDSKNIKHVSKKDANSSKIVNYIEKFKPNACFIIGYGIITKKFMKVLPKNTINIHLGLSPWYRGAATLFWPTYNMEPWKTGVTFHKINKFADSGDILHQCVPKFDSKWGVIDTSVNAIIKAQGDLNLIAKAILKKKKLIYVKQPFVGRSYLTQSFRGTHLIQIYEKFQDKVLGYFIKKKFQFPKVKLIKMKFK